ncbi:hypothetical protein WA026_014653 [Henosepilachna vigintioctopunctata]|uniref:Uncharacterized protein n=1 Tax=Henosepilachna vigintioctopunctata TaxID=420089 RepID=A0AAW1V6U0_9CUCU
MTAVRREVVVNSFNKFSGSWLPQFIPPLGDVAAKFRRSVVDATEDLYYSSKTLTDNVLGAVVQAAQSTNEGKISPKDEEEVPDLLEDFDESSEAEVAERLMKSQKKTSHLLYLMDNLSLSSLTEEYQTADSWKNV